MILLLSFAALLPRILLGFCFVHLIWGAVDGRSLLVKFFLAAAVGFGASSLFGFLWIWLGLPLTVYAVIETVLSLTLTVGIWIKDRNSFCFKNWTGDRSTLWGLILVAGLVLFVLNLALYARGYPHGRPDAWINWNVVARFIYLGGADWQATFLRQLDHPDYPLFMALTNALTWVFTGSDSVWSPVAFHFVISMFTAGLLLSLVNLFRDFKQAALATVVFVSLPFTVDQGMRQYADFLLAYLILAASGLTLLYFQTKDVRLAILAGCLIGLGGWAKNEGLASMLGLTLVWAWVALKKQGRAAFRNYLLGLALPLAVIVLFKQFLAPSNDLISAQGSGDLFAKILDMARHITILKEMGIMLWNFGGVPISLFGLIILAALLLGASNVRIPGSWYIVFLLAFQMLVYFAIYLLTPLDLAYHLRTSLDRLYMHVFPLALFWFFTWLRSPQEIPAKES